MKTKETKNLKHTECSDSSGDLPHAGEKNRFDCICTAAYYKACERQFTPGHELEDWLAAEAEFDAKP
jgi:hypothetical protein